EAVRPPNVEPGQERVYAAVEGVKAEVHLYSDGRFPDAPDFVLGNLDLHFHVAGQTDRRADNVGIVSFNAVRDETDPSLIQVFARIQNYGEQAVSAKFELEVFMPGERFKQRAEDIIVPPIGKGDTAGEGAGKLDRPGERSVTIPISDVDEQKEVVLHGKITG